MTRFFTLLAAATVAAGAFANDVNPAPFIKKLDIAQLRALADNPAAAPAKIPADLGGNFSSWEFLADGNFDAKLEFVDPCPVSVYYCTTDPYGWGVDSWCIEGVFDTSIRVAGMPFIDYYNINNFDTGLTYNGKPVMVDELSNHYSIGVETFVNSALGRLELAMLYYVDDPDNVDNVIGYGVETVQLDGDYKDYTVNMSIAGETTDGQSLKVDLAFADATNVKTALYVKELGYDPAEDDDFETLVADQRNDATLETADQAGSTLMPLGATGTYVVVTTYDTDEQSDDNYKVATYDYEAEWSDWGTADYTDDYLSSYYTDFPILTVSNVRVQRHDSEERYRLVNPYTTDDTWTSVWSKLVPADSEVNSYMEINAVNPEHTYVVIAPSDITDGDGVRLVMGSAAHYNIINGRSDDVITEKGYWGSTTYSNDGNTVSVSFPKMVLMMRQISSEYPLFAGMNDAFKLVMTASSTTGITDIEATDNSAAVYYDLQGRKVVTPTESGVYIVRNGSDVKKLIVK